MKKIFLLGLFGCTVVFTNAQSLGRQLISGSLQYATSESDNGFQPKTTTLSLAPKAGFFLSDAWVVGLGLSYSSREETSLNNSYRYAGGPTSYKNNSRSYGIGPFTRYYFQVSEKAAFFGQAGATFYMGSTTNESSGVPKIEWEDTGYAFQAKPGFVFFPGRSIGLECTFGELGYQSMESQKEGAPNELTQNKGFVSKLGLNGLTLGISLYMGRASGTPAE